LFVGGENATETDVTFANFKRLTTYDRSWLRTDVLGGLTVAAMLLPQSMAYAELGGMPPEAGFYAVLLALVAYALLGTSRHLGVGPEPGTAILSAAAVATLAAGDPARYGFLMAALALLVGVLCWGAAALRLGFVADLLSKPVLVGYITGVGLTLVGSQLSKATGVALQSENAFARAAELVGKWQQVHLPTFGLSVGALALILLLRRWRAIPGALIAVGLGTALTAALGLDRQGVVVVGDLPQGLPRLSLPTVSWADLRALLPAAFGVALVGFSDNVLTARSIAAGKKGDDKDTIDANQELIALGATNVASGVCGGFPVSSSASRSFVPSMLGTHSTLVSLVAAAMVALALLVLGPVMASFPQATLAGVILAAAVAIVDVDGFRTLWTLSKVEFALAATTTFTVMLEDVLSGVVVAVVLSAVVALWRMARPNDAVLGSAPDVDGWVSVEDHPDATPLPGLLVYRFDAPLFFANATWFKSRVWTVLQQNPGRESWLVFDFDGVGSVDSTAVDVLCELLDELKADAVEVVALARANHRTELYLRRAGLLSDDGPLTSFPTINAAVAAFERRNKPQA